MKRFVSGESRSQATLFPEFLDDFVTEDNRGAARWRVVAAIVPTLDFDQQARYVGANWARRRLGS